MVEEGRITRLFSIFQRISEKVVQEQAVKCFWSEVQSIYVSCSWSEFLMA